MNDTDLFAKASKAGYDYQKLYGKFPDKIGIHYKRMATFRPSIIFPKLNPIPVLSVVQRLEDVALESLTISQHRALFEPCMGPDISWDEVYLPIPGGKNGIISGAMLAKMAKEFEE